MDPNELIDELRQELVTTFQISTNDPTSVNAALYTDLSNKLQELLHQDLNNRQLSDIVSNVIGFYQENFWYGALVFSQLSSINMRPLRMYKYINNSICEENIGYLATGPNVRNNQIYDTMLKEPRCWLFLLSNRFLLSSKRKRLIRKVANYINTEPITEYKTVLYGKLQGCLLGKVEDIIDLPISEDETAQLK